MNPTKGKGTRYIYCQHEAEGDCLSIAAHKGWNAFNCEQCEIYMQSESAGKHSAKRIEHREDAGAQSAVPVDEHIESAVAEAMADRDGGQEMATKTCSNCGLTKDIEEFTKNLTCKDGFEGQCKNCRYEKAKKRALKKKGDNPDRLEKIKESAERVKKIRGQKSEASNQKKNKKLDSPDESGNDGMVAVVADPVSADIVSPVIPFNVEKMEERNRADVKVFARAFVAGLKNELIMAMTEQMSGQTQGSAPTA